MNLNKRSAETETETETETLASSPTAKRNRRDPDPDEDEMDGSSSQESKEELIEAAMDIVEGVVLRSASGIVDGLKASYDKDIYSDVLHAECSKGVADLGMSLLVERTVLVPIVGLGRVVGVLKVPYVFYTKSGRALLLLEVKAKKGALKECDMETLGCAVEQIALATGGERPRAMLVNFCSGVHTTMVMQCDGTISN
jgi:hypothetical protein